MTIRVVLATHNAGKRREWSSLLGALDIELVLPEELGIHDPVDETGATYEENALLKARALARLTGLPALADDSGLEVDALGGAPGIHSARFRPGPDVVRYRALLDALADVPEKARTARFRCWAALAMPDGRTFTAEGICEGVITRLPAGDLGFGYDPVFRLPEMGQTMAELTFEVKNQVSHRARAAQALRPTLESVLLP